MQFKMTINIGNATMYTSSQLVEAIRYVANYIERNNLVQAVGEGKYGAELFLPVRDFAGDSTGHFALTLDDPLNRER